MWWKWFYVKQNVLSICNGQCCWILQNAAYLEAYYEIMINAHDIFVIKASDGAQHQLFSAV